MSPTPRPPAHPGLAIVTVGLGALVLGLGALYAWLAAGALPLCAAWAAGVALAVALSLLPASRAGGRLGVAAGAFVAAGAPVLYVVAWNALVARTWRDGLTTVRGLASIEALVAVADVSLAAALVVAWVARSRRPWFDRGVRAAAWMTLLVAGVAAALAVVSPPGSVEVIEGATKYALDDARAPPAEDVARSPLVASAHEAVDNWREPLGIGPFTLTPVGNNPPGRLAALGGAGLPTDGTVLRACEFPAPVISYRLHARGDRLFLACSGDGAWRGGDVVMHSITEIVALRRIPPPVVRADPDLDVARGVLRATLPAVALAALAALAWLLARPRRAPDAAAWRDAHLHADGTLSLDGATLPSPVALPPGPVRVRLAAGDALPFRASPTVLAVLPGSLADAAARDDDARAARASWALAALLVALAPCAAAWALALAR